MKTETKVMIGVAIASILILVIGGFIYSKSITPPPIVTKDNPALLGNGDNVIKASKEKVQVVEFGDFECPACKATAPYIDDLFASYKDTEMVSFVWRTFPIHGHSVLASRAAFIVKELSNDPNKFFEMGDLLFKNQDEWSTASGATNQADLFAGYAQSLGVDPAKFKEILATNKYEDIIEKDRQDAGTLGTNVTPTFYVNGQRVEGGDVNTLKALIDAELKK